MRVALTLGLAAALLCHTVAAPAAEALPAESFGAIPQVTEVELSPSGNLIAWCNTPPGGPATIVIFDVGTQKYRRSIPLEPGLNFRSISWADDETVLFTVSTLVTNNSTRAADHYEYFRTFATDVGGGKSRMLLMRDGARGFVTGADLLAARTSKPKTVMMATVDFSGSAPPDATGSRLNGGRKNYGSAYSLYEVDTRTGTGRAVESGNGLTNGWVVDADGAAVARIDYDRGRPAAGGEHARGPVLECVQVVLSLLRRAGHVHPDVDVRVFPFELRDGARDGSRRRVVEHRVGMVCERTLHECA